MFWKISKSQRAVCAVVLVFAGLEAAPCLACAAKIATVQTAYAQPAKSTPQPASVPQAAVTLNGKAIFSVEGVLSFPAQARAEAISKRIEELARDENFRPQSIAVDDSEGASDILAGDRILMSVTDQDAQAAGKPRLALAQSYAGEIDAAMTAYRQEHSVKSLVLSSLYAVLCTALLFFGLRLLGAIFRKIYRKLDSWRGTVIPSLRIQKFELMPSERIADFAIGLAKLLRLALVLAAFYFYISLVLGFFPATQGYAQILFGYVLSPLKVIGAAVITYLPNFFYIAVIVVVAFYAIKAVRIFFTQIGKGTITLPDFYPEWAEPTYKIIRVLLLALTAIVIFPYIPGSKSPAFQGISIFLGVLVSLGSTSAVSNVVAGVILTYMRAFRIGDRVQIADTVGDVMEKTLLITRIRTIKNVEITIANSMVLSSHIVNYSASAAQEGLILHTVVTIGYDAPWRTVHQLLIDAALACENILKEPRPFVYQTVLDDFYVHYEINASTDKPSVMARTYSGLHTQIQEKFNAAGIEIMSSHYANIRDGNHTTIPENHRRPEYAAPSFRVELEPSAGRRGNDGNASETGR